MRGVQFFTYIKRTTILYKQCYTQKWVQIIVWIIFVGARTRGCKNMLQNKKNAGKINNSRQILVYIICCISWFLYSDQDY